MDLSTVRQCADLVAVILVAIVICGAIVGAPFRGSLLVTAFALLLALFLPGYALIAALFPEDGKGPVLDVADLPDDGIGFYQESGIDVIERVVFSFVVSVLVTPLLGLMLDTTPYGLQRNPVAIALTGVTVIAAIAGIIRRISTPSEKRFSVWPYISEIRRRMTTASQQTIVLNGIIIVCLLIAASGAIYAAHGADEGETFTELYLLSETEDGDLIAEVPEEFASGETQSIYIGIGNREQTTVAYTVVIQLERVDHDSGQVMESEELKRYEKTLEHEDETVEERLINPTMEGERLRLSVLLYDETPPVEPTVENAYRDVYAWIDVGEQNNDESENASSHAY